MHPDLTANEEGTRKWGDLFQDEKKKKIVVEFKN